MDDHTPANENNEPRLNKIDLSQLQSFNFGTQWTEVKPLSPGARRDADRGERRDRRDDGGSRGPAQRDRRSFHKPAGPSSSAPAGASTPPGGDGQHFQPQPHGDRPASGGRRFDRGQGGPRRDFHGERHEGGGQQFERGPYISPYFVATCYPEDTGFAAMVKAVRASCRTYQLFEITKAVLEKNDRFVVVVQRARPARPEKSAAAPGAEGEASAKPAAEKPAPLYMSLPDHLPFDTEDAAIQHVLANNLSAFFDTQEVEIEPPKGSFPIINKCGITGELLGPPNYHRYQQILQQHHAAKLSRMPFERFRESIVSVREPEIAAQWLEKMKKATRYTWKAPAGKTGTTIPPFETTPPVEIPQKSETETAPAAAADASAPTPVASVAVSAVTFDNIEDARLYLLANARDKVVRAVENVRFHGKLLEKLPPGEIRRALEGHVERQRRFPLDTANALRGRLRRENFTIFKKGSRGVSYVCAVKRRFRVPGQVFSETIAALIDFIEKHPMIHVKDLPKAFLGVDVAAATTTAPAPEGSSASQTPFVSLPPDQAEKLRKMGNDLRWLVMEGYVTEFSDGKLFSPPPMAPQTAKKAESGEEEHDPVDFPDAPAPVSKAADSAPPTETEAPAPAAPASVAEPVGQTPEVAAPAEEPKPEPQV